MKEIRTNKAAKGLKEAETTVKRILEGLESLKKNINNDDYCYRHGLTNFFKFMKRKMALSIFTWRVSILQSDLFDFEAFIYKAAKRNYSTLTPDESNILMTLLQRTDKFSATFKSYL